MSSTHDSRTAMYVPLLKGLAIAGSLWNAGTMTSGYRLLPAVYPTVQKSPRDAAKQWEFFYWSMSATVPLTDLATIAAIGGLAYIDYHSGSESLRWKIWATAAGIMPIGWVWVRKVMLPPSYRLLAIANPPPGSVDSKDSLSEQTKTIELLKEFNSQMGFRMLFPWVVGGLALWATLSE